MAGKKCKVDRISNSSNSGGLVWLRAGETQMRRQAGSIMQLGAAPQQAHRAR